MVVDPQTRVQGVIDLLVTSGAETGVQVAVVHDGDVVVDAVAGLADPPHTQEPVTAGTLFFAASTGKGVATSIAHMLVERGDLRYDQLVAEVWPEFATHGKDRVTLRHVLLHTAGVPGLWPQISAADLCDWDRMCAFIADHRLTRAPGDEPDSLVRAAPHRQVAIRKQINVGNHGQPLITAAHADAEPDGTVHWGFAMSLDGFVAGPGPSMELLNGATVEEGFIEQAIASTGAVLAGRDGYDSAIGDSRPLRRRMEGTNLRSHPPSRGRAPR